MKIKSRRFQCPNDRLLLNIFKRIKMVSKAYDELNIWNLFSQRMACTQIEKCGAININIFFRGYHTIAYKGIFH